jgi:hypothetical protein
MGAAAKQNTPEVMIGLTQAQFAHRPNFFGRLFRIGRFEFEDQRIDVAGAELSIEVRHTSLSMSDDGAEIVDGLTGDFIGNESRPSKMTAVSSLAMTLRAILLINGIRGKRGRVGTLRKSEWTQKEQKNCPEPIRFQVRTSLVFRNLNLRPSTGSNPQVL